jgi:uncharacterized protein YecE (DUF72 family)
MPRRIFIGTAGWSIPRASAHRFPGEGTHLQRYASVFPCAEINSSFHRPHSASTYARWAARTPSEFRFAIKVPRTITHEHKLRGVRTIFDRFLAETAGLGRKRGPLLVQLPPSLSFEPRLARTFLELVRSRYAGNVVCEPRHESWFSPSADSLLTRHKVARVAADPVTIARAGAPGGWGGLIYYRLHGAPRKYWSRYEDPFVAMVAGGLGAVSARVDVWCVFDNTASGAAIENAWDLRSRTAPR